MKIDIRIGGFAQSSVPGRKWANPIYTCTAGERIHSLLKKREHVIALYFKMRSHRSHSFSYLIRLCATSIAARKSFS